MAFLLVVYFTLNVGRLYTFTWASQAALVVKNQPANSRDLRDSGSIAELGRSSKEATIVFLP